MAKEKPTPQTKPPTIEEELYPQSVDKGAEAKAEKAEEAQELGKKVVSGLAEKTKELIGSGQEGKESVKEVSRYIKLADELFYGDVLKENFPIEDLLDVSGWIQRELNIKEGMNNKEIIKLWEDYKKGLERKA